MNLPFVLTNPWGALALLGLPVVIAIHCLQQKSRPLTISTLFLLERLAPDSREGRQFTWLRGSLAFWLQILCVLVLTWLLMGPRWLESHAVQRVALVLDSSMSMRAFTGDIVARVDPPLRRLAALTPRTYWTVTETDPSRPTLYEGFDLGVLESRLKTWLPALPAHDPTHALELARSLAPREALEIFVTDRPRELPSGVDLLAIGEPLENCGLVGSRVTGDGDDLQWEVLAQNYGKKSAHRFWWLEFAGQKTAPQPVDLEPGHPQLLHGKFPPGIDRLEVCLDADRFALDDRMAFVRPAPKKMTVELLGDDSTIDLFARLAQTLPSLAVVQPGETADLGFRALDPKAPFPGSAIAAIIVYNQPGDHAAMTGEPFVAENDPLDQDLNWQGLILQPVSAPPVPAGARVLLWKDRAPVIYLRTGSAGQRQLVFNFNFSSSNAARLPAFVLLVRRFVDELRLDKRAPESRNLELAQSFTVAADPAKGEVILRDSRGKETSSRPLPELALRAPSLPGFFSVTQGAETVLSGAAQFADARESDFATAITTDTLAGRRARLVEQQTRADAIVPLWLLLIGTLLIAYWTVTSPRVA